MNENWNRFMGFRDSTVLSQRRELPILILVSLPMALFLSWFPFHTLAAVPQPPSLDLFPHPPLICVISALHCYLHLILPKLIELCNRLSWFCLQGTWSSCLNCLSLKVTKLLSGRLGLSLDSVCSTFLGWYRYRSRSRHSDWDAGDLISVDSLVTTVGQGWGCASGWILAGNRWHI